MLNSSYLMQLMKMSNRHELLKRGLSWRDICISLRTSILMYKCDLFFVVFISLSSMFGVDGTRSFTRTDAPARAKCLQNTDS